MRFIYAALFIYLGCISSAHAEYRVYELSIINTVSNTSRTVISTLDDQQYPGYYPLKRVETVSLVNTWMCWGRHGEHKKPCPNPNATTID